MRNGSTIDGQARRAISSRDQVVAELRRLAAGGRPGDRIESSRALTRRLGVGPVTVQRALDQLVAEGLLTTRPGAGTYVAVRTARSPESDVTWQSSVLGVPPFDATPLQRLTPSVHRSGVVLSSGYLDPELQAAPLLDAAAKRVMRRAMAWDHTQPSGDPDLRAWFAASVGGQRTAGDVVVAPGGQAALSSTFRALAATGEAVIVESPTYPGAVLAARATGVHLVPWPAEPRPDPAELDELLAATGSRVVYAQSRFANPTGFSWDDATRHEILEILRRRRAFLIDDDWAADLDLDGTAPGSLAADDSDGFVITIRSLTKLVAPGLRIAAVVARGPVQQRVAASRLLDDVAVSGFLERTALEVLTSPSWPRHLRQLHETLRERREVLIRSVERWLGPEAVDRPSGGLHVWVRLPEPWSAERLAADAGAAGVHVSAGTGWYPGETAGERLRLSFSAASPDEIRRGMTVLRRCSPT